MEKKIFQNTIFIFCMEFFILALFILITGINKIGSDNYFMVRHAELILSEGFIDTEPLTLHEGLSFMYPQWFFAVIIYLLQTAFGNKGVVVFIYLIYLLTFASLYKLSLLISGNNKLTVIPVILIFSLYIFCFHTARPLIITVLISLTEVYCIEKYIKGSPNYLYFIPLLSFILINIHNSLWIVLFLVFLCYVGEWVFYKVINKTENFKIKPLLIPIVLSVLAGFINPYGLKYTVYVFTSIPALKEIGEFCITELRSPTLEVFPMTFIVLFFDLASFVYALKTGKTISVRFVFMFAGFAFMALLYQRNYMLFITLGQLCIFNIFKGNYTETFLIKRALPFIYVLFLFFGIFSLIIDITEDKYEKYDCLYTLSNYTTEGTVFSDMDAGSLSEYLGFRPYIDGRAEVFGVLNNKKKDINAEYIKVLTSNDPLIKETFLDEYQFDYIVSADRMDERLAEAGSYKIILGKKGAKIYAKE